MTPKHFPQNIVKYAESPVFTKETVPAKLTKNHSTKAGTWGRLIILEGSLDYIIPRPPETNQALTPEMIGIIEPEVLHHVKITDDVSFKVEFWK